MFFTLKVSLMPRKTVETGQTIKSWGKNLKNANILGTLPTSATLSVFSKKNYKKKKLLKGVKSEVQHIATNVYQALFKKRKVTKQQIMRFKCFF